ncbi:MAG: serine hydrolase domain-containing protein [Verrucomicrobiota bacterium]
MRRKSDFGVPKLLERYRALFCLLIVLVGLAGCSTSSKRPAAPPGPATQPTSVFDPAKLAAMDAAINQAIAQTNLPGGVLWVEHRGQVYARAYGQRAVVPAREAMTVDTIFDAASLTKVLATTPAMLWLIEQGRVNLDAPVQTYLPEFTGQGREPITIRHLMTHSAGLPPGLTSRERPEDYASGIRLALKEKPATPPATAFRYSDVNFILLGEIVRRVSGQPLNEFVARHFYEPLGMRDTGYLPPTEKRARIAPTEAFGGAMLRGTVHDPTARRMDGVAGHAGVFTTAADLARYARMLLGGGILEGVRVLKPETVRLMTTIQSPVAVKDKRGLGWDIDSPHAGPRGKWFPVGSYGHTGWTGTSVWIDPASQTMVIFLSNRNHPDGKGNVVPLRAQLGTLAAEALRPADYR